MTRVLREWARPEIVDTAEQTARQQMHARHCPCSRCHHIRAGRDRIVQAARPLRRRRQ
ncbi:hypothetical protein ABZ847_29480 [Streptomyces bauhiniae]